MTYLFIELPTKTQLRAIDLLKSDVEFCFDSEVNQASDQEIIRDIILKQYTFDKNGNAFGYLSS